MTKKRRLGRAEDTATIKAERTIAKVQALSDRPGTEGEKQAAESALERLRQKRPAKQTRVRETRVTATCQYPDACDPHTFDYVRTTRPQVYCPPHRDGWTEGGRWHGGERHVRVIRNEDGEVIGRRLVTESFGEVEKKVGRDLKVMRPATREEAEARVNRELRRAEKDFGIRRFIDRLYHWREVEPRIETPGVVVTTSAIVTGRNGKPRWDPTLWRAMQNEAREVGTKGALSLDMDMTPDSPTPFTLDDVINPEQDLAERAPLVTYAPSNPPLISYARRRVEVAFGIVLRKVGVGSLRWRNAKAVHSDMWRDDPAEAKRIEDDINEAVFAYLMTSNIPPAEVGRLVDGLFPVSPEQSSDTTRRSNPSQGAKTK